MRRCFDRFVHGQMALYQPCNEGSSQERTIRTTALRKPSTLCPELQPSDSCGARGVTIRLWEGLRRGIQNPASEPPGNFDTYCDGVTAVQTADGGCCSATLN